MGNTGYASDDHLSERAQLLLKALVETYIREGHPVGSRVLSRESGLSLSSATVRNVMADLEDHGFVVAPHTSAGRMPTDKGYRFFVNTLLRVQPPAADEVEGLQRAFEGQADNPKALVAVASQLLSSFTRLAGVVMVPRTSGASHVAHRVRGAVREPRAGHHRGQRPRGAEPRAAAGPPLLGGAVAARRQLPERAFRRPRVQPRAPAAGHAAAARRASR